MGEAHRKLNHQHAEIYLLWPYRMIYYAVAKAGLSSIRKALNVTYRKHYSFGNEHDEPARINRRLAWELRSECRSFAFVRNPFDRLISAWANKVQALQGRTPLSHNFCRMPTDTSFPDFVRIICTETPQDKVDQHTISQSFVLYGYGNLLPDFLGRFENFAEDWKKVQAMWPVLPDLTHENASHHKHYRDVFTPEMRDMAARYYADDLKNFNYEF